MSFAFRPSELWCPSEVVVRGEGRKFVGCFGRRLTAPDLQLPEPRAGQV